MLFFSIVIFEGIKINFILHKLSLRFIYSLSNPVLSPKSAQTEIECPLPWTSPICPLGGSTVLRSNVWLKLKMWENCSLR